jgi:DNA-binding LacI/PurR family transcriptional regulator
VKSTFRETQIDRPTQKDVARLAGVTQSTVSLVLGKSDRVGSATRRRVEKAVTELNYSPNLSARSLATCRTNTFSVLVPSLKSPSEHFFVLILEGLFEGVAQEGFSLTFCLRSPGESILETVENEINKKQVDGMFILSPHNEETDFLESIKTKGLPFVTINRRTKSDSCPCVAVNYGDIAHQAYSVLFDKGHRRIGFINGPQNRSSSIERLHGVRAAVMEFGLDTDTRLIVNGNFEISGGYHGMKQLLELRNPPTAVFSGNDYQAFGAIQATLESGLKIPEDIAIIGCDDWATSSWLLPPLTTIRVPYIEMGLMAADLLSRITKGQKVPSHQIILNAPLVVRSSI